MASEPVYLSVRPFTARGEFGLDAAELGLTTTDNRRTEVIDER
jgi:hypothetical protein